MNSNLSIKLYNLIKTGVIKSNAHFWKSFYNEDYINTFPCDLQAVEQELKEKGINVICVFDENNSTILLLFTLLLNLLLPNILYNKNQGSI